jgi:selenide,water dikinase
VPGGTKRNLTDLSGHVDFASSVDATARTLLGDAQTSGGLLIALPGDRVATLLHEMAGSAAVAAVIGSVREGTPGRIEVE